MWQTNYFANEPFVDCDEESDKVLSSDEDVSLNFYFFQAFLSRAFLVRAFVVRASFLRASLLRASLF